MRFFEAIMRNWLTGMILFVLTALVLSVNISNAAITSPYVQEKQSLFFHNEISQIAFNVIENDLEDCCLNERNLVPYRNWVLSIRANAAKGGFKIEGQLAEIFGNKKLFLNWLKGNHSLSRVGNPLNATEAQQIINNAKNLGLPIESNLKGLQGLEITGQWGGIPNFKVGNVHIPIEKGLDGVLKF